MNTATSFYELLEKGIMPEDIIERSRIDEIHSDVMEFMGVLPMFASWIASLKRTDQLAMRDGDDVPVITTTYNISKFEAAAIRNDDKVMPRFFNSMSNALVDGAIPMAELFAIITDGMYSMLNARCHNIETIH